MKRSVHVPVVSKTELARVLGTETSHVERERAEIIRLATGGSKTKRGNPEHEGQARYFSKYVPQLQADYPALAHLFGLTYANPNWMGSGKNTINMGKFLKAEGKRPGVPDLTHPVARFGYHGLYIENKIGKTPMSFEQEVWAGHLQRQGYAAVCLRALTPDGLALAISRTVLRYTEGEEATWYNLSLPEERWL